MQLVAVLLIGVVSIKLNSQKCVERNSLIRFVYTKFFCLACVTMQAIKAYPSKKVFARGILLLILLHLQRPELSVRGQSIRFVIQDVSEAEDFYLPDPTLCNCSSEYRSSLGKTSHHLHPARSKISPDQGNLSKVTE